MLAELLSIVAPIYVCIGLGWAWVRIGRRYDTELVTDLVMNVGAPCLVFSSLVGLELEPALMGRIVAAVLAALACFALLGGALLRLTRLPATSFLPPLVFANTGNMGLPVCLFAFGDTGLALAVCVYATNAIAQYTAGQWLWSGQVSFTQLLRTPLTYASMLALLVLLLDLPVPLTVQRTTALLGDFTIPLMQFTLGVTLGQLRLGALGRTLPLSLLRLAMGFGVGVGLAALLGLEGTLRGVFVLQCSMPVAVINYMLAERYERHAEEVAGTVVLSTLIALASLPLVLAWLVPH